MSRGKTPKPEEKKIKVPAYIVTFSDMVTLLLTFFVLLLSFSSFSKESLSLLKKSFASELSSISPVKNDKGALTDPPPTQYDDNLGSGSEKPTLTRGSKSRAKLRGLGRGRGTTVRKVDFLLAQRPSFGLVALAIQLPLRGADSLLASPIPWRENAFGGGAQAAGTH